MYNNLSYLQNIIDINNENFIAYKLKTVIFIFHTEFSSYW